MALRKDSFGVDTDRTTCVVLLDCYTDGSGLKEITVPGSGTDPHPEQEGLPRLFDSWLRRFSDLRARVGISEPILDLLPEKTPLASLLESKVVFRCYLASFLYTHLSCNPWSGWRLAAKTSAGAPGGLAHRQLARRRDRIARRTSSFVTFEVTFVVPLGCLSGAFSAVPVLLRNFGEHLVENVQACGKIIYRDFPMGV